jgi:glyoxylate reductase
MAAMRRVLVTKPILDEGVAIFRTEGWEVEVLDGLDRAALLGAVGRYEAVVSMLSDRFDAEVFTAASGGPLKIVANYAVGYDNIDVVAAARAGIAVTNTPDVLTDATAEMSWALVFAAARRIVEGDALARSGRWSGWRPTQLVGTGISGKTVGIVGAGRIGRAFGRMGRGFGVKLVYWSRSRKPEFETETDASFASLEDLLRRSDIVSIHLPGGPATRHLLSADRLALMKPSAVLVNTGRGAVIDEAALAAALKNGRIAAAGLDVYEQEPVIHPALFGLTNVVLAPHLGSATRESRTAMAARCARNIAAAFRGEPPPDALLE